jgi:hypothetical protein
MDSCAVVGLSWRVFVRLSKELVMRKIAYLAATTLALAVPASSMAKPNKKVGTAATYTGVVTSIMTHRDGTIINMYIKDAQAGVQQVKGCNARLVDQPMLLWAIQHRHLVYLTKDTNGCFANVDVKV